MSRSPDAFSLQDFAARAHARLRLDLPAEALCAGAPGLGDHSLDPGLTPTPDAAAPKPAAVLVAAVPGPEGARLLFIERASGLRAHAGQIAFPGGRMEAGDESPLATALREAEEEIGLPPEAVRPLGFLDAYQTGTGYRIVPVVAVVERPFEQRLCALEVADAFEAPLSFLMSPENHAIVERERGGRLRTFYAMPFGERYIWGATAGMVRNLYERLYL
ncbi:MAG: NUDIX hydrolase [Beijerinckiaceae bacterium]